MDGILEDFDNKCVDFDLVIAVLALLLGLDFESLHNRLVMTPQTPLPFGSLGSMYVFHGFGKCIFHCRANCQTKAGDIATRDHLMQAAFVFGHFDPFPIEILDSGPVDLLSGAST